MSQFLVRFSIVMDAPDDATAAAETHAALREGHMREAIWQVTPYCPDCEEYHASETTEITTESPRVH